MSHFSSIFNPSECEVSNPTAQSKWPVIPLNFTLDEVKLGLSGSRGGKAPGPDGVPIDFYKVAIDLWGPVFRFASKLGDRCIKDMTDIHG